jgi:hypothetical protein
MEQVTEKTLVELYELCLDICPFPTADREKTCPGCPLHERALGNQWRLPLGEALKAVKGWVKHVEKKLH